MRSSRSELMDTVAEILKETDRDNANISNSPSAKMLQIASAASREFYLNRLIPEEMATAHKRGDIHIHDLSMLTGYCAGWSLKQLIQEGLGGIEGKITSAPAKHLSVLCNQMVNFLGIMQNEWAGAQAFSSFDTYLAPFVKADGLA